MHRSIKTANTINLDEQSWVDVGFAWVGVLIVTARKVAWSVKRLRKGKPYIVQ